MARLRNAEHYQAGLLTDMDTEKDIQYDLNSNILALKRYAGGALAHDMKYSYYGNRIDRINLGAASYQYIYDHNGNITKDAIRNLDLEYNYLNLVNVVTEGKLIKAKYSWLPDGTKVSALDPTGTGLLYKSSLVYKKDLSGVTLESAPFAEGRFQVQNGKVGINFFITDHLGSVRTVFDYKGNVIGTNDYHPFGLNWNEGQETGRYLFGGKESQSMFGFNYQDFHARFFDNKYTMGMLQLDLKNRRLNMIFTVYLTYIFLIILVIIMFIPINKTKKTYFFNDRLSDLYSKYSYFFGTLFLLFIFLKIKKTFWPFDILYFISFAGLICFRIYIFWMYANKSSNLK